MRVALVTGSYNYIKDGIALTLNRTVEYLEAHGVDVLVFTPTAPTPAFAHKGTVVSVPSLPLPRRPEYRVALGLPHNAKARLRAFAPNLIHIAVPDVLGWSALRFARHARLPVVASYHTRYETYLKHYGLGFLRASLTRYLHSFYGECRELYVPSTSMAEVLAGEGIRTTLRLWPRGVDIVRFHPDKRSDAWRVRHGIGLEDVVVISVGRLVREKQLAVLCDVIRNLTEQGVAHRSVIVGDGPERAWLQRRLPQTVFTGFLDGDDLATAYASADIFLFPSDTESFGNVTLEAMASELPAVCADATGSRSLVQPDTTGFLVAPGRVDGFVAAVRQLADDPALRRRMGEAARARSLGFSWDAAMARLLGYYREVVEQFRAEGGGAHT